MPTMIPAVSAWLATLGTVTGALTAIAIDVAFNFAISRPPGVTLEPDADLMATHAPHAEQVKLERGADVRVFEGFDPTSRGIFAVHAKGTCTEPEFMNGSMLIFDRLLQPRTGDLVAIRDEQTWSQRTRKYVGDGDTEGYCKWLEYTDDGRMIAHSNEGAFELDPERFRVVGRLVMALTLPPGMDWEGVQKWYEAQQAQGDPSTPDSAAARRESNRLEGQKIRERDARRAQLRESQSDSCCNPIRA